MKNGLLAAGIWIGIVVPFIGVGVFVYYQAQSRDIGLILDMVIGGLGGIIATVTAFSWLSDRSYR